MEKGLEQFDFSKEKDQEKFNELPENKKEYLVTEQQESANRIKEKVDTKEAENYQEAEKIIAKEDVTNILDTISVIKNIEAIGSKYIPEKWIETVLKSRKEFENICGHLEIALENYEQIKTEKNTDRNIDDVKEIIYYDLQEHNVSKNINYYFLSSYKWENAIQTLSFKEGLDLLSKNKIEDEIITRSFFDNKVTSGNLNEFLDSNLSVYIDPNHMLEEMRRRGAKNEIKIILDKYNESIDFEQHPIYGSSSIFKGFEDRSEKEREAIDISVDRITKKLVGELKEIQDRRNRSTWRSYTDGYSIDALRRPITILRNAADYGIVAENYEKYLARVANLKPYLETYASSVIQSFEKNLSDTESLLDKISGKQIENITGKGLEFVHSSKIQSGAEKIYLDGKYIFSAPSGSVFSENPTNGEIITFLTREHIDSDYIKGTQKRDTVYVWKRGWDKPKDIFEDHAYSKERYFRILPPEVTTDGNIKFTRISGEETVKEEIEI